MQVGDLVRWTAADVFVVGVVAETNARPDVPLWNPDIAPIHRVIVGDLEMFLFSDTLEVISASR